MMVRKVKKLILILACIIILCIDCFATIIYNNDSSAFITKAEFEMMKNNFRSQLDSYNANLDNKIDNAITSYLAGIDISVQRTYDVINKGWKEVTFINGCFDNEYKVPDIYYLLAAGGYFKGALEAGGVRDWSSHSFFYYIRANNTANRKNCFKVLEGTEGNPISMQWKGIARGYRESIVYALESNSAYGNGLSGWNWPNYDKRVMVKHAMKPTGASYSINSNSVITDIALECQSKINTSSTWSVQPKSSDVFVKAVTSLSIGLDSVDGKEYDTEHIVGWSKDTTWEMYCPDWNHTWQLSANQTITDTDIYNATTKSTTGWYQGLEGTGGTGVRSHTGSMPFSFENGTNHFYSVGLYATAVKNSDMYQMSEDMQYKSDKSFTVNNLTLEAGLPVLAAARDDEVTFNPVISSVQCYDETGVMKTNENEVDIYFSYVPFTEKNTTTDPVKWESGGETHDFVTTTNRKATVKFKMEKDSVVYMQIKPHFDSTATYGPSHPWVIDYDLTGDGGIYKVKVAETR